MSTTSITVRVPLSIRRRPGRKTVVTPVGAEQTVQTRADPALLKALARAFRWQKMLEEGRYASISEMAAAEKIERGYLGKVLQLTLLPPAVVEAILEGRHGAEVTLPRLMKGATEEVGLCHEDPAPHVGGRQRVPVEQKDFPRRRYMTRIVLVST